MSSNIIRLATTRRTTRAALFGTWFSGGTLELYDEASAGVPEDGDEALTTQVLLATFELPEANGDAADGVWTVEAGTPAALIQATGTPEFARAYDSLGGEIGDFDVGDPNSDAAVKIDNLNLVEGALVSLVSLGITEQHVTYVP